MSVRPDPAEQFKKRTDAEKVAAANHAAVVRNLIESAQQHHGRLTERERGRVAQRQDAFMEVIDLSIHYANACAKQHEGSEGMRRRLRGQIRDTMNEWCKLGGKHGR